MECTLTALSKFFNGGDVSRGSGNLGGCAPIYHVRISDVDFNAPTPTRVTIPADSTPVPVPMQVPTTTTSDRLFCTSVPFSSQCHFHAKQNDKGESQNMTAWSPFCPIDVQEESLESRLSVRNIAWNRLWLLHPHLYLERVGLRPRTRRVRRYLKSTWSGPWPSLMFCIRRNAMVILCLHMKINHLFPSFLHLFRHHHDRQLRKSWMFKCT
jgi:hypothetical protein